MRGPTFFASLQPGRDRHEQFFPHLRFAPYFVALPIPLALPTLDDVDDQTVGHLFETWALAHVFALHEDPEGFQRGFLGGVGHANHGRAWRFRFFGGVVFSCFPVEVNKKDFPQGLWFCLGFDFLGAGPVWSNGSEFKCIWGERQLFGCRGVVIN